MLNEQEKHAARMSEDFSKNKSEDARFNINFRSQFAKFTAEGNVFAERAPPFKVNSHKSYLQLHWKDDNEYEQQFNFTSNEAKSEAPIDDLTPKQQKKILFSLPLAKHSARLNGLMCESFWKALINCLHKERGKQTFWSSFDDCCLFFRRKGEGESFTGG